VPLELAAIRDTCTLRPAITLPGEAKPTATVPGELGTAGTAATGSGRSASGTIANVGGNTPGTVAAFRTLATILAAGLLDGINPCAFSTLLFFLSFIALRRQDRRSLLLVGCSFIGAVFLAYFLMGFGLLQALRALLSAGRATYYVKGVVSLVAAVLVVLNLRDARLARQGRAKESALQMPQGLKKLSHRVIRSFSLLPLMVLGAALTGFLVSVIELACTGQVYLPTLVYMNQSALSHWSVLLLTLYNLGFIVPLVAVFILVLLGLRHEKLRVWYGKHLFMVRLGTAVLFGVMGVIVWL
jgi:cytochrome c biogenesis protein CcdA